MSTRRMALACVVGAAVVVSGGCGRAGPPPSSGVVGHYWVCASAGRWQPAHEAVEIFDPRHNRAVIRRTVTRQGRYALYVAPGHYRVIFSYQPLTAKRSSRWPSFPVTVRAHKTTVLNDAFGELGLTRGCGSSPPGPPASYPPGPYGAYIPFRFRRRPPAGAGSAIGL